MIAPVPRASQLFTLLQNFTEQLRYRAARAKRYGGIISEAQRASERQQRHEPDIWQAAGEGTAFDAQ